MDKTFVFSFGKGKGEGVSIISEWPSDVCMPIRQIDKQRKRAPYCRSINIQGYITGRKPVYARRWTKTGLLVQLSVASHCQEAIWIASLCTHTHFLYRTAFSIDRVWVLRLDELQRRLLEGPMAFWALFRHTHFFARFRTCIRGAGSNSGHQKLAIENLIIVNNERFFSLKKKIFSLQKKDFSLQKKDFFSPKRDFFSPKKRFFSPKKRFFSPKKKFSYWFSQI